MLVPSGDTASRPASPQTGTIRYNSETGKPEFWTGSAWKNFVIQRFTEEITSGSSWSVPSGVSSVQVMVVSVAAATAVLVLVEAAALAVLCIPVFYPVTPGGSVLSPLDPGSYWRRSG